MKGKYPIEYFRNPNINKPIKEIWNDIDSYTGEFFEDEPNLHEGIDFVIPIPPLDYKGKQTKGVFYTQALEFILKLYPKLKEIFFCGAYTMWSNYSWCDQADFYLNCYENKPREEWHKNKYQRKKDIIFIPLQDADFTDEYTMAPTFYTPKTIDLLSVATCYPVKNLPLIAQAIKIYKEKYNYLLKATFVVGRKDLEKNENGSIDYSKLNNFEQKELKQMEEILGNDFKKMEIIPYVNHKFLPRLYSSAKCCVLASLIEGKNRSLNEAMSCDTPIIAFKDHNKWARGNHPIFFGNSGELIPKFNPESFADTIYKVINNPKNYEPRKNYLIHNGRINFVNKIANYIPYFRENIPDFVENRIHENLWINLALQKNYQLSYHDYIYGKNYAIMHVKGLKSIDKLIKFYFSRFNVK